MRTVLPMATNKEQFDKINARLDEIEARLSIVQSPRKKLSTVIAWAGENKPAAVIIAFLALMVAVLGIFVTPLFDHLLDHIENANNSHIDNRIDAKLKEPNDHLRDIEGKLTAIQSTLATLQPFIDELVRHQMDKAALSSQPEFRNNLQNLSHTLAVARTQGTKIDPSTVNHLAEKLLELKPRPDAFWQASAELVSFRSFNGLNLKDQAIDTAKLPDCTDGLPTPMTITDVIGPHTAKISRAVYENCRFVLDSNKDDQRLNAILAEHSPLITFRHCLIVYRGGPINLILAWKERPTTFSMEDDPRKFHVLLSDVAVEFVDCLLDFSLRNAPEPNGQSITSTLLAQNGNALKLPKLPAS
jgi:hypothetical protein